MKITVAAKVVRVIFPHLSLLTSTDYATGVPRGEKALGYVSVKAAHEFKFVCHI